MTLRAYSLIRSQPWYRREAFARGLSAAGFEVIEGRVEPARAGDVLLIWNRYGDKHFLAVEWEKRGGIVLVAENGYLGANGSVPKWDVHPRGPSQWDYFALARWFHNDDQRWEVGGGERWKALGIELRPWRTSGEHVLVLPNRPFGPPGRAMPSGWAEAAATRLRRETKREVRIRAHPGNDAPRRPLAQDLIGAWAAVVWSSSAGVHALVAGIPTFSEAPAWSMHSAAAKGPIDAPFAPERLPAFERLAWGQWTCSEIESGEPFRRLLSSARQGALA